MNARTPRTLDEALWRHGALTRLARELGVSRSYLCDIRKGRAIPSRELANAIVKATGIPPRSLRKAA